MTPTRPGWYWFLPDGATRPVMVSTWRYLKSRLRVKVYGSQQHRFADELHGDWEPIEPPPRMVAEVERRKNTKEMG